MSLNNPAFRASAKIYPSRFVTISGDRTVSQAVAASAPIGVAQDGSKLAPGVQALVAADLYAADVNDPIQVYGLGDVCLIEVGTAADLTAGMRLSPDANGAAIVTASTKWAGAIALENASKSTGSVTNYVLAQVIPPTLMA